MNQRIQNWAKQLRQEAPEADKMSRKALSEHWIGVADGIENGALKEMVLQMAEEIGR